MRAKPNQRAEREAKIAALKTALHDEGAAWRPRPAGETCFTVQYREPGLALRHDRVATLLALEDWLLDENRSACFVVRPAAERRR